MYNIVPNNIWEYNNPSRSISWMEDKFQKQMTYAKKVKRWTFNNTIIWKGLDDTLIKN